MNRFPPAMTTKWAAEVIDTASENVTRLHMREARVDAIIRHFDDATSAGHKAWSVIRKHTSRTHDLVALVRSARDTVRQVEDSILPLLLNETTSKLPQWTDALLPPPAVELAIASIQRASSAVDGDPSFSPLAKDEITTAVAKWMWNTRMLGTLTSPPPQKKIDFDVGGIAIATVSLCTLLSPWVNQCVNAVRSAVLHFELQNEDALQHAFDRADRAFMRIESVNAKVDAVACYAWRFRPVEGPMDECNTIIEARKTMWKAFRVTSFLIERAHALVQNAAKRMESDAEVKRLRAVIERFC